MTKTYSARERILALSPFPTEKYASIDLNRLTTYTIDILGTLDIPSSIENIAVANHRMFPRRFAMVGFPEYPDLVRVNRALLQLGPKYRNWATGIAKLGWSLTQGGIAEAEAVSKRLKQDGSDLSPTVQDLHAEPSGHLARTLHGETAITRIRSTSLFEKSLDGWKDVSALEVFDVLESYTHTPAKVLRSKLRRLKTVAADMKDKEVETFLDQVAQRFPTLFRN